MKMEIEYKGANCVVLKTKNSVVVIDPEEAVGLKDYGENALVLYTDQRFATGSKQSGFVIDMPGEFEHGEASVRGVAAKRHIDPDGKKATMYRVELGGIRLAVVGHIEAPLPEDDLEAIGVVDVLIVPVGGNGYTLDARDAASVIRQIGPRVAIPTHFDDGTKYEVPQEKLAAFETEFGGLQEDKGTTLKIKSIEELPEGPAIFELQKS
jgi:L-ascorbate metabolism protein UlaG (beta-lactamase superfamily)